MGLADAPVTTTVEVVIGEDGKTGSAVFSGIPAGTEYEIHERKQDGLELKKVAAGAVNSHEDVAVIPAVADTPAYAKGTAYASDQEFTFTNAVQPFTMLIEKHWDDEGAGNNRPDAIGIQILRKVNTADQWENVTKTICGEEAVGTGADAYIELGRTDALTENPSIWKTELNNLPVNDLDGNLYTYRIQEVTADGASGWNLENYTAAYVQGDPVTGAYIVTNTPNSITVKKEWQDGDDPSRPVKVRVQLQHKLEGQEDTAYKDVGDPVVLDTNSSAAWTYVYGAVPRVDDGGNRYVYRVVEKAVVYRDGTEQSVDNEAFGYRVSCSSNEDDTVFTVTNSKGTGKVILRKTDSTGQIPLAGAVFKLERLKSSGRKTYEEAVQDFKVGEYNREDWAVDPDYSSVQRTTDADGEIDFGFLPFGYYRVTEMKAPEGYILPDNPYDFYINQEVLDEIAKQEEGKTCMTLAITNRTAIELPASGAVGTMRFTAAGLALLAIALLIYGLHLKRDGKGIRR